MTHTTGPPQAAVLKTLSYPIPVTTELVSMLFSNAVCCRDYTTLLTTTAELKYSCQHLSTIIFKNSIPEQQRYALCLSWQAK
jgi:hypothetical protein